MTKKNGFSLVEMMVVVAILAIVAAVIIPRFREHKALQKQQSEESSPSP
ncbi:MAG: type II secretion system protein [Deltaproteobacteria bacterium]|nr:type II secretion system protein [Deltaproteobacteria bacterium]